MVWVVEKKIFHHIIDLGFERVKIPVRVRFEFEVKDGVFVPESLSTQTLFNRRALERRYPNFKELLLEDAIEKTVRDAIHEYLKQSGYLDRSS